MNLDDLFNQARSNLEAARQALVELTNGLKSTPNTDFAEVMSVATEVAKAEAELAKLAQSWMEQAAESQQVGEGVYDDIPLIKETMIYDDQWKSPQEIGNEVTFDFDKFLPAEEE